MNTKNNKIKFHTEDIEKTLQKMKPAPLTPRERMMMWSKIEKAIRKPDQLITQGRRAIISFFLLGGLLLGGGASAFASANDAVPGDLLYSLKRATENVRVVFALGKTKDDLRVRFAEERYEEIKTLLLMLPELEDLHEEEPAQNQETMEEMEFASSTKKIQTTIDSNKTLSSTTPDAIRSPHIGEMQTATSGKAIEISHEFENALALSTNTPIISDERTKKPEVVAFLHATQTINDIQNVGNTATVTSATGTEQEKRIVSKTIDELVTTKKEMEEKGNKEAALQIQAVIEKITRLSIERKLSKDENKSPVLPGLDTKTNPDEFTLLSATTTSPRTATSTES